MSQKDFNDLMNNPNIYQIEDPHTNMSHTREAKTNQLTQSSDGISKKIIL